METVVSKDGTRIAVWCGGEGRPLLLVHGATADHATTWRFVGPMLEQHFTVCVMDRRGRGESGDAPDYDLRREAEDVAAVVEAVAESAGAPVAVLGHSFGALCALEAALLTDRVRRLILYDHREGALVAMYRDLVKMPPEEFELLRAQQEAWERRLVNTSVLPRELQVDQRYAFEPERFKGLHVPTLLLVGGDSPPVEARRATAAAAALPDVRAVTMPGQQHAAMYTAPDEFVSEVVRFLRE